MFYNHNHINIVRMVGFMAPFL